MAANAILRGFLTSNHPIYDEMEERWERNEAAYRGGDDAREYLQKFQWETLTADGAEHFENRQATASYVPFPSRMVERFVGYLSKDAPSPGEGYDFGSLGEVREMSELTAPLTRAELLWYDADNAGGSFLAFMNDVQKWSVVTGHRWVGVESPRIEEGKATTLKDEQDGLRPYLVDYSPLNVPNWHFEHGKLAVLRIEFSERILSDTRDAEGNYEQGYTTLNLLYVAEGFDLFGDDYSGGGWWMFDSEGEAFPTIEDQWTGDLVQTEGVIPFVPMFFATDRKTLSRPGLSDIAASALGYMNLSSAGDNDAIEGGGRTMYVLGVDKQSFNVAAEVKKAGGRLIPVPPATVGGTPTVPTIFDTASVDASTAIETAIERKNKEVAIAASDELVRSPDASGEARRIEFQDVKAPRLSLMAGYRESVEIQLLRWVQQRFGLAPDASVVWPNTYDVDDSAEDWTRVSDLAFKMGVESATLNWTMISSVIRDRGLVPDEDTVRKIEDEIRQQAEEKAQARADLLQAGGIPSGDEEEEEEPEPETAGANGVTT